MRTLTKVWTQDTRKLHPLLPKSTLQKPCDFTISPATLKAVLCTGQTVKGMCQLPFAICCDYSLFFRCPCCHLKSLTHMRSRSHYYYKVNIKIRTCFWNEQYPGWYNWAPHVILPTATLGLNRPSPHLWNNEDDQSPGSRFCTLWVPDINWELLPLSHMVVAND